MCGSSRAQLTQKTNERDKVIGLFRRGRISNEAVDKQLDEIAKEESSLGNQIDTISRKLRGINADELVSAEALLRKLSRRLEVPTSWDVKRQMMETLIGGIRIDTIQANGKKQ